MHVLVQGNIHINNDTCARIKYIIIRHSSDVHLFLSLLPERLQIEAPVVSVVLQRFESHLTFLGY